MPLDPVQAIVNSIFVDEKKIYVGMGDYRIHIWNIDDYSYVGGIDEGLWEVRSIFINQDNIYAASLNEQIIIYDKNTFEKKGYLEHELGVTSVFVDTRFIYSTGYSPVVGIWDKTKGTLVGFLENHLVRSMAVTSDEKYIYTGDGFTTPGASVKVWIKSDFTLAYNLSNPPSKRVLSLYVDDQYLYSCHGSPGEIRVWEKDNFNLVKILKNPKGDVVTITCNESQVFATSKDSLYIWNKDNYNLIKEIEESDLEFRSIFVTNTFVYYGCRSIVKIINPDTFELLRTLDATKL